MAKRKTLVRKPKQAAHQCRSGSSSKHASVSPSVASSPSPQPQDLVQRRRKGTPIRSPSQGDPSKGIVFAFRIQNDSDLSMAVDILSYDQVLEERGPATARTESVTAATAARTATISVEAESWKGNVQHPRAESTLVSSNLKMSGEHWSSDSSLYLSSNVIDLNRNVLILHSRKPQESSASSPSSPLFHPYRRSSAPSRSLSLSQSSTPPLTDSGSSSSASSSPSSPANSPTLSHPSVRGNGVVGSEGDICSLDSLSSPSVSALDAVKSQPPRMLSVRGLGAGGRRMQVYLV